MDTQKITTQYRLTQWAKVIQARQDSGQNIKEFCQATGISKSQSQYNEVKSIANGGFCCYRCHKNIA